MSAGDCCQGNWNTVDKECQAIKRELEALKHTMIGWQVCAALNKDVGKPAIHLQLYGRRSDSWWSALQGRPPTLYFCVWDAGAVGGGWGNRINNDRHRPAELDPGRSPARQTGLYGGDAARRRSITCVSAGYWLSLSLWVMKVMKKWWWSDLWHFWNSHQICEIHEWMAIFETKLRR